jgi:hypothetical protein
MAVALGVVLAGMLWGGIEVLFRGLAWWRGPLIETHFTESNEGLFTEHPRLGYAMQPGAVVQAAKYRASGPAYAVTYTIDAFGRRHTPHTAPAARPSKALFFGGSFTFGEGVEDAETLPAQFAKAAPDYAAINYGCKGYGPQHMWLQATAQDFTAEGAQTRGVAFYVFIDHHLARLAGSMQVTATWGANLPHVTGGPAGLQYQGSFETSRPIRQLLYRAAMHLPSVDYLHLDWPPVGNRSTVKLLAQICAETRDALAARFEQFQFYVILFPGARLGPRIQPALKAAGVEYLDFSGLFPLKDEDCFLIDGHPSLEGHRRLAEAMAQRFQ